MKSEQNLNAVKQNFESTKCFKSSENKGVRIAEVDLLTRLSSGECSGPWASCFIPPGKCIFLVLRNASPILCLFA